MVCARLPTVLCFNHGTALTRHHLMEAHRLQALASTKVAQPMIVAPLRAGVDNVLDDQAMCTCTAWGMGSGLM